MGKSTNYFGQPVFQQAINFIKKSDVIKIASDNQSDRYTKRFDTYNHLMIMLYGAFNPTLPLLRYFSLYNNKLVICVFMFVYYKLFRF